MSEYTPGDVEIRSAYIERQWNAAAILSDVSGPWFDRWLAAHDEQVRATGIQEAANSLPGSIPGRDRVNEWLWQYSTVPAEQKASPN